jgi:hypothetical protein
MASPVRSYVFTHSGQLRHAAFFAVMGGRGGAEVVREMQIACGASDASTCILTQWEVERELYRAKCASFIQALKGASRAGVSSSPNASA